ncbi:3-oxoacyl-[acyl-carrier protein] reductase [Enhygromyxa salina]|uniref:3-oxoacyl-[acyl-carrier protein] reductase n=1 Tax=Enhygromyxa salina TaxID=215803 RepID=A0A0C2DCW5_9BACT|nr:SDR family oxidoreductase [Enhygromyxa salina]KIG17562.1 3-oxoacyl-[acyl-carrier protein] reductase [Enhygromyxa salina]
MEHFRDKVVWITGASAGIGEALAQELARRGAKLVLSARREALLEQVRERCERADEHMVVPLDLSDAATIEQANARVLERYGNVDILINNSGISQRGTVVETQIEVDRRIMEVNYIGTVALTKAVLPSMLARGRGQIVVISSLMGKIGTPLRSAYAASKHALQGFFDCLRAEVHDRGVHVSVISPGYVHTEITKNALTADGSVYDQVGDAQSKAMSAEQFATRCADAIARRVSDKMIGGPEVWAARLAPFFPRVYEYLVRRVKST